jgi:hypothetical protein
MPHPFGSVSLFGRLPKYKVSSALGDKGSFASLETAELYQDFLAWQGAPEILLVSLSDRAQALQLRRIVVLFRLLFATLCISGILFLTQSFPSLLERMQVNGMIDGGIALMVSCVMIFLLQPEALLVLLFSAIGIACFLGDSCRFFVPCRFIVKTVHGAEYFFQKAEVAMQFQKFLMEKNDSPQMVQITWKTRIGVGLLKAVFLLLMLLGIAYWFA